MAQRMTAMTTPCIKVCVLDPANGLCTGCGRDIDEIARWSQMTDDERARIMAALPQRLAQLGARRAPRSG
jgi:predicted Fe-S protein YdhL (DUF1289 family)